MAKAQVKEAWEMELEQAEAQRLAANNAAVQKAAEASAAIAVQKASEVARAKLAMASSEYQEQVAKEVAAETGKAKRQTARSKAKGGFSPLGHRNGSQGAQMDEAILEHIRLKNSRPKAKDLIAIAPELAEFPLDRIKGHVRHVWKKHSHLLPTHLQEAPDPEK